MSPIPAVILHTPIIRTDPAMQVSLDNLWTLQKLREEGDDERGGESSVFDRGSLRALPLGLGLHYASLTETQRAQIARRYTQQAPPTIDGSEANSRARDGASTAAAAASAAPNDSARRPPSPTPALSGANDDGDGGGRFLSPPSNLPPPPLHSRLSPPEVLECSPVAREGAGGTPLPWREEALVSSPRSAEMQRLSLSQIDRDVLDCLPSEVRDEVLRAIALNAAGGNGDGGAGSGGVAATAGGEVDRPDRRGGGVGNNAAEGAAKDADAGLVEEEEVVDVCSPSSPSQPSSHLGERPRLNESQGRSGGDRGVFEMESAATLRAALRVWVGGAVRYPSQWHLELLYR